MKKTLKIAIIVIALLILAVLAIPYLFRDQITTLAKKEISNSIDGEVNFSDIHISLIKSFPNLEVEISQLTVIGTPPSRMTPWCMFIPLVVW